MLGIFARCLHCLPTLLGTRGLILAKDASGALQNASSMIAEGDFGFGKLTGATIDLQGMIRSAAKAADDADVEMS